MSTAYDGTHIVGFRAASAPNPGCCGDSGVLCRNCARLALGLASNVQTLVTNVDRDATLVPPSLSDVLADRQDESAGGSEPCVVRHGVMAKPDDDPAMIPPVVNWGEEQRRRQTQQEPEAKRACNRQAKRGCIPAGGVDPTAILPLPGS